MIQNTNFNDNNITSKKIFLFAEFDNYVKMCLLIATNLKLLDPTIEPVLIDVSKYHENCISGAPLFENAGFKYIIVSLEDKPIYMRLGFAKYFWDLFKREQPLAIVIPHEIGYAGIAVNVSHEMGILSMQYQHGDIGPNDHEEITEIVILPQKKDLQHAALLKNRKLIAFLTLQKKICRDEFNLIKSVFISMNKTIVSKFYNDKFDPQKFHNAARCYVFTADIIGVNGDYYKQHLLNIGISEHKIIVTGNLRTDQFFNQPILDYPTLCNYYDLDCKLPLIIYFYSPIEEYPLAYDSIAIIHDVITVMQTVKPDYNILVLNHPRRNLSTLQSIIDLNLPTVKIGYTENNFWSLCNHSDLIIGTASAAVTESLLAGKPIITQNYVFEDKIGSSLLSEYNAVIPVFHKEHLKRQIERALFDKKFVQHLIENQKIASFELMGHFDGRCCERFARSLLQIINNHEKRVTIK